MRRYAIKYLAVLAAAGLLGGCGFQLREQAQLLFSAAYVDAPDNSPLGNGLRLSLGGQKKRAMKREDAAVIIRVTRELHSKTILSLSGTGKVSEYRLEYEVEYAAYAAAGTELIAPSQIHLTRDFNYDDNHVLAKETEEATLNRSMEEEALRQTLRRLTYIKP